MNNNPSEPSAGDSLIDEVRAIRQAICEQFDNDVDRLCDHLETVEQEYRNRTGRFANVPRTLDNELFPDAGKPAPTR